MKRIGFWPCAVIVLALVWLAAPVQAALAPYLQTIGYDQVLADPTFNLLTGSGQAIAVLDTGVDASHESFTYQALVGGISGINFNFSDSPAQPVNDYSDGDLHGTFVTSVAVGNPVQLSNGVDQSGLAPLAGILAVRVLNNNGSGDFTTINNGLAYIVDQVVNHNSNIRVVNMSLGTAATFPTTPDDPLVTTFNSYVQTLKSYGIPVVVAAGNSGSSTGLSFPAIVDDVISVGSTTEDGSAVSTFSNRNASLDLLAPGENIYGAYGVANPADSNLHNLYAIGDGTSFAAPQVAGAILLLNERYFDLFGQYPTVDQLAGYLADSGVDVYDPASDRTYSRLDLYNALVAVPEPLSVAMLIPGAVLILLIRRRAPQPLAA